MVTAVVVVDDDDGYGVAVVVLVVVVLAGWPYAGNCNAKGIQRPT